MKILHTADWHLGQTFYEYSRYDEHVRFLDWLRRQIKERKIDVLLVAGDIFDGPNPSAESQRIILCFVGGLLRGLRFKLLLLPAIMIRQPAWKRRTRCWRR